MPSPTFVRTPLIAFRPGKQKLHSTAAESPENLPVDSGLSLFAARVTAKGTELRVSISTALQTVFGTSPLAGFSRGASASSRPALGVPGFAGPSPREPSSKDWPQEVEKSTAIPSPGSRRERVLSNPVTLRKTTPVTRPKQPRDGSTTELRYPRSNAPTRNTKTGVSATVRTGDREKARADFASCDNLGVRRRAPGGVLRNPRSS